MRRSLPAFASVLALLGGTTAPAAAQYLAGDGGPSEGVLTDTCRELPEDRDGEGTDSWGKITGEACDTVRVSTWNVADACWTGLAAVGAPADASEQACEPLYGQRVSDEQVDEFEGGWVELAHRDQNRWARPLPLGDRSVVATHNSYNSLAYGPALARMDPNQTYSMRDQLRMGVRRLELDVHYFLDTSSPDPRARRPVLCHATGTVPGTVVTDHTGCSIEFTLAEGLAEIDAWLDANRDQIVMLRFESHLDGPAGYDAAAASLRQVIGDHLYTPPGDGGCHVFDTSLTAAEVLATGTHVLAVSGCKVGTAAWRGLVWDDSDVRREATYEAGHREAFRAGRCPTPGDAGADLPGYPGGDWIRFYNDGTWLSATAARSIQPGGVPVDATAQDAAAWMRCGVNQPAFDFLTPTDARMEAMVWSWAEGENLEAGRDRCAVLATDGRFHSERCGQIPAADRAGEVAKGKPFREDAGRPYLCRVGDTFAVTSVAGSHEDGETVCALEFDGGTFTFPRTAQQALAADAARAAAGAREAWLALAWDGTFWR